MFRLRSLASLSEEISALASRVLPATAIVTGQTDDFSEASGSAWMWDAQHLVTNRHVVADLVAPIWVRFPNSDDTQVDVVGVDELTDLAVLRLSSARGVAPLRVRKGPARLGELCFAFGSPLGQFPESMTLGIVSGLRRPFPSKNKKATIEVIQTDCAINPGNSGGPLIDTSGELIGVNTAIIRGAEGIGFAVPGDIVESCVPELIEHRSVRRATLGVSVASRPDTSDPSTKRLVVVAVRDKPTGDFEVGDAILSVNGLSVSTSQDLIRVLGRETVDTRTAVSVRRQGAVLQLDCYPRLAS